MLIYCTTSNGNFGDNLNPWLWSRLAPEICDERNPSLFLGIGTILGKGLPRRPLKFVFGSGWCGRGAPKIDERWLFYCVRGPLTAAGLGLDKRLSLTDPAVMLRSISFESEKKCYPVSLMPHHQSMMKADWIALCQRAGIHCIDPRSGVDSVIRELHRTCLLLSESLHGAIVADSFRIPWIPVRIYSRFAEFKWHDWAASINVPLNIINIPPVFEQDPVWYKKIDYTFKRGMARTSLGPENWERLELRVSTGSEIDHSLRLLEAISKQGVACLSSDSTIERLESMLFERLSDLREAWWQNDQTSDTS